MSPSFSVALPTVAFQVAAALEDYVEAFDTVLSGRHDDAAIEDLGRKLDHLRNVASAFPGLAADVVELLLCHTELLYNHWGAVTLAPPVRVQLRRRHYNAAERVRDQCMTHFCRTHRLR